MKRLVGILAIVLALPLLAGAQGFGGLATFEEQPAKLSIDPMYPAPGETVTVKLEDVSGSSYGSTLTWTVDGTSDPDGANQRSIEIVAGPVGTTQTVTLTMTNPNGGMQTLTATIDPIFVDIIIEPQTRVPDWYPGRGLPSIGSMINATVLVNDGTMIDPQGLVYNWRVNNKVLEGGSVRGRNKMAFPTPRGTDMLVSVSVSRAGGKAIAGKAVRITSTLPELLFYEQHSLYGSSAFPMNSQALLVGSTIKVQAEPYNLDINVYNNPDVAEWKINAVTTDNATRNPYEITLQRAASTGRTNVEFHVRSLQTVLQGVESDINLNF